MIIVLDVLSQVETVPEVIEAKENTATVDTPSETPSNEIK